MNDSGNKFSHLFPESEYVVTVFCPLMDDLGDKFYYSQIFITFLLYMQCLPHNAAISVMLFCYIEGAIATTDIEIVISDIPEILILF